MPVRTASLISETLLSTVMPTYCGNPDCPDEGRVIPEGEIWCPTCESGQIAVSDQAPVACPECGTDCNPAQTACWQCGQPLPE